MQREFIEEVQQSQEKIEIKLSLPKSWWFTTYSYSFYATNNIYEAKIIPLRTSNNKTSTKEKENLEEVLPTPSEWDFSKGDYRMQESGSSKKQYAYNNRLKVRILKYSIYPALALALLFTFVILGTVVGM